MIPVVADEAEDLLQFKVLFLTLHSQVVQGQMNHIHPGGKKKREKRVNYNQNINEVVTDVWLKFNPEPHSYINICLYRNICKASRNSGV